MRLKLIAENPEAFDNFEYLEEQANLKGQSTLYIKGPFIGCDMVNKNKRMYGLDDTRKDVLRYIEEMVTPGRAMGELNHPSCNTSNADILTEDGWKSIVDVKEGELIPTLNMESGDIEIHPIKRKIDQPYNGKMYRLVGRNIDVTVTPNHRFPLIHRYGKKDLVEIQEIYNNRSKYNKSYIPKLDNWFSDVTQIVIPAFTTTSKNYHENDVREELVIPSDILASTKGIYLDDRFLKIEEIDFDDNVYCVTVENETFYCRENGKAFWSGNSPDVNLERACHLVTELFEQDGGFHGKSKVLSTPCGQILRSLINDGVKVGVSTRALGSLKESSDYNLVQNMYLVAIDAVADPSYPKAFVNGILESKSFVIDDEGRFEETYDNFEKTISKLPKKDVDSFLREQVLRFINALG